MDNSIDKASKAGKASCRSNDHALASPQSSRYSAEKVVVRSEVEGNGCTHSPSFPHANPTEAKIDLKVETKADVAELADALDSGSSVR